MAENDVNASSACITTMMCIIDGNLDGAAGCGGTKDTAICFDGACYGMKQARREHMG